MPGAVPPTPASGSSLSSRDRGNTSRAIVSARSPTASYDSANNHSGHLRLGRQPRPRPSPAPPAAASDPSGSRSSRPHPPRPGRGEVGRQRVEPGVRLVVSSSAVNNAAKALMIPLDDRFRTKTASGPPALSSVGTLRPRLSLKARRNRPGVDTSSPSATGPAPLRNRASPRPPWPSWPRSPSNPGQSAVGPKARTRDRGPAAQPCPRTRIQPKANAIDAPRTCAPRYLRPCADGGASTSAATLARATRRHSPCAGSSSPLATHAGFIPSTAPCVKIGPISALTRPATAALAQRTRVENRCPPRVPVPADEESTTRKRSPGPATGIGSPKVDSVTNRYTARAQTPHRLGPAPSCNPPTPPPHTPDAPAAPAQSPEYARPVSATRAPRPCPAFARNQELNPRFRTPSGPARSPALRGCQIRATPPRGMVGMGVGDHRTAPAATDRRTDPLPDSRDHSR